VDFGAGQTAAGQWAAASDTVAINPVGAQGARFGIGDSGGVKACRSEWILLPWVRFVRGNFASNVRPASTLRNLFGWFTASGEPFVRIKGTGWTSEGTVPMKLGFWMGKGSSSSNQITKTMIQNSVILGTVNSTEQSFDLTPALDVAWPALVSGDSDRVVGGFWIGPEYGTDNGGANCNVIATGCAATDSAATAGVKHVIPWGNPSTTRYARIGSDGYPFNIGAF